MINKLNVYIGTGTNPYENLAIEKYLLDEAGDDSLTLYLWQNENTIVIGRNQNPWAECNCNKINEESACIARRLSGGGAVFHDLGNLNFTFLSSVENQNLANQLGVIAKACRLSGIEAEVSGRNDILASGRKFSGNAFYNSRGKAYHHGTILISTDMNKMARYLTPSEAKLSSKGVKSVKSRTVNLSELSPTLTPEIMRDNMICSFEQVYGKTAKIISEINTDKIKSVATEYASWDYIYGKTIPFTLSCEEKFDWGQVNLQLNVEKGIIKDVKLYTDSMDWSISELTEKALLNCHLEEASIKSSLETYLAKEISDSILILLKSNGVI